MILFFYKSSESKYFVLETSDALSSVNIDKLNWLFSGAKQIETMKVDGFFIGPRKEMITPWSTNAVEICQNMGIESISRIEEFIQVESASVGFDSMLQRLVQNLDESIFEINKQPERVEFIIDIAAYNASEGLALSTEEVDYLNEISKKLNGLDEKVDEINKWVIKKKKKINPV